MAERDLIRQLEEAITAMLAGGRAPAGPEVTELLRIGACVRDLPDEAFRRNLKEKLMESAVKERQEKKGKWIPEGYHTVTPYLHPANAAGLIDFLKATFGAEELGRYADPGSGRIMHAALRIGDSMVEMGEPPEPQPTSLCAYLPDVDATYRKALEAGASSLYEPVDQSYGYREAGIKDPAGNVWFLAKVLKSETYKDPGVQDVGLYMFPRGASAYIDFLVKAFGAEIIGRHESPEGRVAHADLKIGDSRLFIGEAHDQWQPMPAGIHYYVPDVDSAYARAIEAGGKPMRPPTDQPYGERGASVADPQGNQWYIATLTS